MSATAEFRIANVRRVTINTRPVKLFIAYRRRLSDGAYICIGQFAAPRRTPNGQLWRFVDV
jgi:hypothetical protein